LVECDLHGNVLHRHHLDVESPGISFLRTATDARGRRYYAAAAIQGAQAHVFDERFHRIGTYPPHDAVRGGIADVLLLDVDHDGQLELVVGFSHTAGVHCTTLEGHRHWENRQMPDVLSLVGHERLIVSGQRGDLLPFDREGRTELARIVPGRAIFHLYAARFPPAATVYCGLTFADSGHLVALGLNREFREVWQYPLPAGVFQDPVQFVTSGSWFANQAVWLLAGPDGTLHAVRDDGDELDKFACGERITGLALTRLSDRSLLLVAGPEELKAWWVEEPVERVSAARR
jgi:hypothetical protein